MAGRVLLPKGWKTPVGYANGIVAPEGRVVFIAGQVGWDAEERFHSEELVPQFDQALQNILAILAEAGGIPSDICRMTAFCIDKPAYLKGRRDLGRIWKALDRLSFGVIGVNDTAPVRPELPFGGMKNSGQEREGGSEGIEAFLETKAVALKLGGAA